MKRSLLTLLLGGMFMTVFGQGTDLAIGQWRSHLPYLRASTVTQSAEKVYYGTMESVVAIDKSDFSIELLNKVTGLNDAGIQMLGYNQVNETLIIVYTNSNIDFLRNNKITNFNLIQNTTAVTGDKSINHILFDGEDAFFSTEFGIVKLDMTADEIRYTVFTSFGINAMERYNNTLFASTDEGIYSIDATQAEFVIKNFNNWEKLDNEEGLPDDYYSFSLKAVDNKLFADVQDTVFVYDGNEWDFYWHRANFSNRYMEAGNGRIVMSTPCYTCADQLTFLDTETRLASHISDAALVGSIGQALEDEEGYAWVADTFRGMGRVSVDRVIEEFDVNGPYSVSIGEFAIVNDEVWAASILLKPRWQFQTKSDGFWSYIDGQWEIFRPFEIDELFGFWDMNTVTVDPNTGNVLVGSFPSGLVEFNKETFTLYTEENSGLQAHAQDPNTTRVTGIEFDINNNLWVSNFGAPNPLVVRTVDEEWVQLGGNTGFTQPTQIVVDRNNFKWIAGGNADKGILVYDDGASVSDLTDDRFVILRPNNSALETDDVRSLAVDLDGNVWAGTSVGPIVFECASQVFDGNCPGRRPTAEEGGFLDFLLGTEIINTIAIDGANRKWFGTNNGIFVLDADAEEEVLRFNELNSPLFSDEVINIGINGNTGEVFIGTSKGILSYRSDATDGEVVFRDVYAFPNPVRPDYTGPIAIKGLVRDANVKITDVSGTLVYETIANGGQAVWDGNDYNGRRANSGVYLVFMTNRDGTKKLITKILFMN